VETLFWLINSQTIGGLVVVAVFLALLAAYGLMLRWIKQGAEVDEPTAEGGEG
jgi:hypothetical protein